MTALPPSVQIYFRSIFMCEDREKLMKVGSKKVGEIIIETRCLNYYFGDKHFQPIRRLLTPEKIGREIREYFVLNSHSKTANCKHM